MNKEGKLVERRKEVAKKSKRASFHGKENTTTTSGGGKVSSDLSRPSDSVPFKNIDVVNSMQTNQ